jgi:hypothetical protein
MNLRVLPLVALLFTALTSSAMADLEIKKARYGNTTSYRDVRGILTAYLRNNTLSFPVNARSMGGDPTPGGMDFLFAVYAVDGREFTDTVPQGKVFTFKGLADVRPVRPPMNLPFLNPISPVTAPLLVINRTPSRLRIYNVDRYQQWVWTADIERGQTLSFRARVGETWIVADPANHVLGQERIRRGDNRLMAEPPAPPEPSYGQGGFRKRKSGERY